MNNRPFKFRAWHKRKKQMFPVASFNEDFVYLPWDDSKSDMENYKILDHPFKRKDCVLLQFTGMLDYFGHEIWEGDIIRWIHYYDAEFRYMEYNYEVVFKNGCFGFTNDGDFSPFDIYVSADVVVGNTFQHKYLLEQSLSLIWA